MNLLLFAGFMIADLGTTAIGVQLGLNELNPLAVTFGGAPFLVLKATIKESGILPTLPSAFRLL